MSRDDDFKNRAGEDLKKDFGNVFKHSRRFVRQLFRGGIRRNNCYGVPNGFAPSFFCRHPILYLLCPKLIVVGIILLTLLFCGVSLYGIVIIILLTIIFILI